MNTGPAHPDRVTVDGVTLKPGDIVWCVRFGSITRCKMTKDHLRFFGRFDKITYSTEAAAVVVALAGAKKRRENAKRDLRRETALIERLDSRAHTLWIAACERL